MIRALNRDLKIGVVLFDLYLVLWRIQCTFSVGSGCSDHQQVLAPVSNLTVVKGGRHRLRINLGLMSLQTLF